MQTYYARRIGARTVGRVAHTGNLLLRPLLCPAPTHLSTHRGDRNFSSRASNDKSWGEILEDAANVAKNVVSKIKDSASTALSNVTKPKSETPKPTPYASSRQELAGPSPLLPQLFGKAIGGLLSAAIQTMGQEVAKSAKERDEVYNEAVARIMTSEKLRQRLGGDVQVSPSISQSVSSMTVNGQATKRVMLLIPVSGGYGRSATAQVSYVSSPSGKTCQIAVQMPEGDIINLGGDGKGGSSFSAGQTIDVDYREVK